MNGLLAQLYSTIDSKKRQLGGFLSNPVETLSQGVRNFGEDQNKLLSLQSQAYPWTGMSQQNQPNQLARKLLADQGAAQGMSAATVWHGSPHKFDKFDSSKIGTGEGAQAYGHGLYLAESPNVAKQYAENVRAPDRRGLDPAHVAAAKDFIANGMDPVEWLPKAYKSIKPEDAKLAASEARGAFDPSLYKVDLPDEHIEKMLDWDKPLSQQHPDVQKALNGIEANFPEIPDFNLRKWMDADPLASTWHNVLQRDLGADPEMITSTLKNRGIPGIRYLDGGSRGAGTGTSNYVVFPGNEGLLNILERNGQAIK